MSDMNSEWQQKPMSDRNFEKRSTVRVSIYSDYTCPWCFLGAKRFEHVRRHLGDEVDLQVTWMPFEIHPEVPEEGMPVEALGYPKEQFARMEEYLRKQAEAEGLSILSRKTLANTHDALAAATFVQNEDPGHFDAFHRGLFRAYFSEGLDLSDTKVLADVARDSGADPTAIENVVVEGTFDDAIAATAEMARRLGITGTPTFVFESEFAVVGAHPVETLVDAVKEVVRKKSASASSRPE